MSDAPWPAPGQPAGHAEAVLAALAPLAGG